MYTYFQKDSSQSTQLRCPEAFVLAGGCIQALLHRTVHSSALSEVIGWHVKDLRCLTKNIEVVIRSLFDTI